MKRFSLLFLVVAFLAVLTSCKKDDNSGPSAEDLQKERLTATWLISSASLDNNDRSSDWEDFTLTITTGSGNGYQTTNSFNEGVWPVSGTWRFQSSEGAGLNTIIRDDNVAIDLVVTETTLRLNFTFIESTAQAVQNRIKSVEGDWEFNFTKQ